MTKELQNFLLRLLATGIVISILVAFSSFSSDASETILAAITSAITG